jgi:hypothetical protein
MTIARFYDSVLSEIEFGKIDQGINLLVGMLDAVHMQECDLANARQELVRHVLHQMLLEEPIYAQAVNIPADYAGLVDIASRSPADERISPTGRRLFKATSNLPLIRALSQRQTSVNLRLERAWKDGLRICLLGNGASGRYTAFSGRDLSNVTLIDSEAKDWPSLLAKSGRQFDLICLAEVADSVDAAALFLVLEQLRPFVAPAGTAILSALRPGHLGSGWREACLNWQPNMHGSEALQRAATDAGFSAHIYSDESDCIIWAELRPEDFPTLGGNKNDEH